MPKASNLTPGPQRYDTKALNQGNKLISEHPSLAAQVRGTFSQDGRFKEYYSNAYKVTNPNIGPGAHNELANFRK